MKDKQLELVISAVCFIVLIGFVTFKWMSL